MDRINPDSLSVIIIKYFGETGNTYLCVAEICSKLATPEIKYPEKKYLAITAEGREKENIHNSCINEMKRLNGEDK